MASAAHPPGRVPADREPPASELLGVRVHHVTLDQAVERVAALIASGGPHQVVTVNGAMLVAAARDPAVRSILSQASLVVPDGVGVLVAARILGRPPFVRVPGVELAERLCAEAAAAGWRVFLLGAAPGVADDAAEALRRRYPGLQVAGVHHGYFSDDAPVLVQIRAARPHVLLVALGFPRQEMWIARHRAALGVPVSMGVGGTLDVLAGRVRRAPTWMQRAGLEWAYRIAREPRRRWRTAAALPHLMVLALKARLRRERGKDLNGQGC
ncbi:MAG: WecB/TagA/CpsF family glycosyltransferase [Armatimonadota bacterium]|nr:WecB/TagA/CpsF family glycosyltransferase [Armatimonadota bacterium]